MEDIKSIMLLDETELTDVAQAVEKRVLEDDLNVAGVLLRDKEACRSKSKANKRSKKKHGPPSFRLRRLF